MSSNDSPGRFHDLTDELRQEFIDEATETVQGLDVGLSEAQRSEDNYRAIVDDFRRAALRLRGPALNFGLRTLGALTHRLDEYLSNLPSEFPPRLWSDLQAYVDLMMQVLENRLPAGTDPSALMRTLPRKLGFDPKEVEVHCVEVLLIMPYGAQTKFVERELQQCGYRVSIVPDTIEAFGLAVHTKPDLIIISAIMPHLDGVELASALIAMPSTRNIPIAVITSLEPGDEKLSMLPKRVPVVHKGPAFGDDLFKALDHLFLI